MLRKILVMLCLLMCLGGAEMPKLGDNISIVQSIGVIEQRTDGRVMEINASLDLMTVQCYYIFRKTGFMDWKDMGMEPSKLYNVSVGLSTISAIYIWDPVPDISHGEEVRLADVLA